MNTFMKLSLIAAVLFACTKPATVSKEAPVDAAAAEASASPAPVPVPAPSSSMGAKPAKPAARNEALEAYVLAAMKRWAPAATMPGRSIAHYDAIARDIVDVVSEPGEEPIWKTDVNKARTAILVAAIGFWESHFWQHVDDGSCNSEKWRRGAGKALTLRSGDCDQGIAVSIFQIHAYGGIALTEDGGWVGAWGAKGRPLYYGKDLLADRRLAVRVALHIARASIRRSGTLCGYSGENEDGCPKARARLSFASAYSKTHPFKE
jgi:hypothetical protein